ncbi:hypothetical protein ACJX0J_003487, partial (mitochondrion) [Zea mays]
MGAFLCGHNPANFLLSSPFAVDVKNKHREISPWGRLSGIENLHHNNTNSPPSLSANADIFYGINTVVSHDGLYMTYHNTHLFTHISFRLFERRPILGISKLFMSLVRIDAVNV